MNIIISKWNSRIMIKNASGADKKGEGARQSRKGEGARQRRKGEARRSLCQHGMHGTL